jgi:hypothetical protein
MKKTMLFASTAFAAFAIAGLATFAISNPASACTGGNGCDQYNNGSDSSTPDYNWGDLDRGSYTVGGGKIYGGGQGVANAMNEFNGGEITNRSSSAGSLSSFEGMTNFNGNTCEGCPENTNMVSGIGTTNNFASSLVDTTGGGASAASHVEGLALGDGFAYSGTEGKGDYTSDPSSGSN